MPSTITLLRAKTHEKMLRVFCCRWSTTWILLLKGEGDATTRQPALAEEFKTYHIARNTSGVFTTSVTVLEQWFQGKRIKIALIAQLQCG